MLEGTSIEEEDALLFRLAAVPREPVQEILKRRGVDAQYIEGAIEVLRRTNAFLTIEDLLDAPFRAWPNRPTPFSVGRFGDGTIGVLYAALEQETCKRKMSCHLRSDFSETSTRGGIPPPKRFFSLVQFQYLGSTVDLRGKEIDHPELVSETDSG